MDEKLFNSLRNLKLSIDNDPRVVLLNNLEEEMNKNEEVMLLSYKKDMLCLKFEDALKIYPSDSKKVREIQHLLYEAKLALDTHELVTKYNKAYCEVKKMYQEINDLIFKDFSKHKCGGFDD